MKSAARLAPAVLAVCLALAGCSTAPAPQASPAAPPRPAAPRERSWGYVASPGTAAPAEWGSLPGNEACATGKRQSPVALAGRPPAPVEPKDLPNLVFKYGTTAVHLVNKGHTVQANVDPGSTLEIDGTTWTLLQFHFHAPSEHVLDGLAYPMEMHLVHAGPDGKPGLVVGVLLVQGGGSPALDAVLKDPPKQKGMTRDDASAKVDLAGLLPPDRTYFRYDGSLTTPPCTEGIRWFVLKSPNGISGEALGAFVSLPSMTPTNRPVQPLAGRTVLMDTTP